MACQDPATKSCQGSRSLLPLSRLQLSDSPELLSLMLHGANRKPGLRCALETAAPFWPTQKLGTHLFHLDVGHVVGQQLCVGRPALCDSLLASCACPGHGLRCGLPLPDLLRQLSRGRSPHRPGTCGAPRLPPDCPAGVPAHHLASIVSCEPCKGPGNQHWCPGLTYVGVG